VRRRARGAAERIYQWHFVRNLKRRMRRKAAAWPGKWKLDAAAGHPIDS
jgi:hypothetical protein